MDTKRKGIFSDTFLYVSDDGKVDRLAIYSPDRVLDLQVPGVYLSIQSDGKWGFNDPFIQGIETAAPFLEDALFFVIYDVQVSRFEILNGKLHVEVTQDFDQWDCVFDKYVVAHCRDWPQVVADYYMDKVVELRLFMDDLIANDCDPCAYYELEEYEDLLQQVDSYSEYIPVEALQHVKEWLNERIAFQKDWDDQYYR